MSRGFILLICINIILFFSDFYTTLWNAHLLPLLELNPLYRITGSLIPIFILNLAFFILIYIFYTKNKPSVRYALCTLLVVLIFFRITAITHAIAWQESGLTYDEVQELVSEQDLNDQTKFYALQEIMLLFFIFSPYLFWQFDHEIKKKKNKF